MKTKLVTLSLSLLVAILAACTSQNPSTISSPQPTPTATGTPDRHTATSPPPTLTSTNPATPAVDSQQDTPTPEALTVKLTQYDLRATLNYARHHLSVDEEIAYSNQTGEPISDLLLIVEPARYPGVFQLHSLSWRDGQPILDYTREIGLMRIPLAEPLGPGEGVVLSLSYELNLPSPSPSYYGRPVPFGYSSRQTNLVDWYPFIPPYVPGEGWLAHRAGPFGEHLAYAVADFEVQIQLSDSNPDLVIAASAPAEITNDWYLYQFTGARNFSWSVSNQYILSTTTVDSVAVLAYYFPVNTEAGEAVLQTTAESLELYNGLFGPYPRKTLTVVEADFLDGMEYDGLYFLSKGFYNLYSGGSADYLTAIAAHETAHQWWYSAVGNDQALEPWLDEALSTYSERLFYENLHPQSLDWWWTYRINYYEPRGWVDGSIYNPEGYRAYRDAVYLNGALFLEDLRNLIGDESFFEFLQAYNYEYYRRIASGDDFFALLEDYSQADISPLLDKYFQMR
jgi:hypothetical protein